MRSPLRFLPGLLTVAAAVAALSGGCEKKNTLVIPDEGAPSETVAPGGPVAQVGIVLRYAATAVELEQKARLEMTQRGAGQYTEASIDLRATVGIHPEGSRLKVDWSISDVDAISLKGALSSPAGEDPKALVKSNGRGAYLCDLLGEADPEASSALAENAPRNALLDRTHAEVARKTAAGEEASISAGVQLLTYLPPVLQLPSLPEQGLVVGEDVRIEREEQAELDTGMVMPIDIEMIYRLVRIDEASGGRIAELEFRGRAVGEGQGTAGTVLIESSSEGTLLFDLDAHLPVSYEVSRTESFELGEFSGETTTLIRASWER